MVAMSSTAFLLHAFESKKFRVWALVAAVAAICALPDAPAVSAERSYEIRIAGYKFDPREIEGVVPAEMRLSMRELAALREQPGHYLVQLQAPLDRETRKYLQGQYALHLRNYVPELAYLERLDPRTLKALSKDPLVRAVVPFEPAFKISPSIGKVEFRTPERREITGHLLRAILFEDADPEEVGQSIRDLGASEVVVLDVRRLGGVARIRFVLPSQVRIPSVARLNGVRWIEEVAEQIEDNGNTAGTIQSGTPGTAPVWIAGLNGEGQIVGVIDSGPVDIDHCMFQDPSDNTVRPDHRKVVASLGSGDARTHATFVAGIVAGDDSNNLGTGANRGNAWAARIVSADRRGRSWTMLGQLSDNAEQGAVIHTNSWHDNTKGRGKPAIYNQTAADVDTFVWNNEDHLVLGSMGNAGEEHGPPGTAKNAIGVNASQQDPNEMNFGDGNVGPTADDRRKPDIVAPGCSITSAQVDTACTITLDQNIPDYSGLARPICATSWATPAAAGAALLVRQYYTEGWYPNGMRQPHHAFVPSGALLKATLVNSTLDMTGVAGYPSDMEGWGVLRLDDALFFAGDPRNLRVWDTRNADGLTTGEARTHRVVVASNTEPLKITLVWSEPPGTEDDPVVNNLDLSATSPDGAQTFLGNRFSGDVSVTGGSADSVNNVEMVLVNNPAPGEWAIRVSGRTINVGNPGQGYALVAGGHFPVTYSVKFVCGIKTVPSGPVSPFSAPVAFDFAGTQGAVQPGKYSTAINVHNFGRDHATLSVRGVIADPLVFAGPSAERQVTIGKFRAREIDCSEIAGMFPDTLIDQEGRILLPPRFMKGFVTITTGTQLNVVAVYTAAVFMEGEKSRPSGLSMDVEVIQPFVANVIGRQ